ncbi:MULTISPECIES: hypothetical protein [unclassified Mycobacterium]|uniref:hypothetical protein n=1 Tax=unclassified Mycobacterium TaxID=2642494 RepID=UPI0029C8AE50|nr:MULTISPECIES: hypothetical protein [unclassified Mycobacterium]
MIEFSGKRQKRFVEKPDGSTVIVRPAYHPSDFMFPVGDLENFDHIRSRNHGGSEDVLDECDGVLSYYRQARRFECGGEPLT